MAFRIIVYNCVLMSFNRALFDLHRLFYYPCGRFNRRVATVSNGPRVDTLRTMASRTAGGVAVATVLAVVISLVVLFKLWQKLFCCPSIFAHWRRQSAAKKHHQTLLTALRALILGDEKKALKIFSRLTEEKNDDPGVYGMLAAESGKRRGR